MAKFTDQQLRNLSIALKGKGIGNKNAAGKRTEEQCKRIAAGIPKGRVAWNKGMKTTPKKATFGFIYALDFSNGKSYIGSTVARPNNRYKEHVKAAKLFPERELYTAWNQIGLPIMRVLAIVERAHLVETESRAIQHFNTFVPHGYNSVTGSIKGAIQCQAVRDKISKSGKGRTFSEEHRRSLSIARMGIRPSAEVRAKMSATRKGRRPSEQTKHKLKLAQQARRLRERKN